MYVNVFSFLEFFSLSALTSFEDRTWLSSGNSGVMVLVQPPENQRSRSVLFNYWTASKWEGDSRNLDPQAF